MFAWEPDAEHRIAPPAAWAHPWPLEWSRRQVVGKGTNLGWLFAAEPANRPLALHVAEDTAEGIVLFHGILYRPENADALASDLLKSAAAGLLDRRLRELSGTFCGLVFDRCQNALFLFTDFYGMERLYYARRSGGWAVSTDPFALARWCRASAWSPTARGGILYGGYVLSDFLLEGVSRVAAGCYVRCDAAQASVREWVAEPTPCRSGREAIASLEDAHRRFWRGPISAHLERAALLLSRGKDSRIVLKYLLETGARPHILSYDRYEDDPYPFVTYLLRDTADRETAQAIADAYQLAFEAVRIPVRYALEHADEIVALNHGLPLHWEALAAAERAAAEFPLMISGFEGDVLSTLHAPSHGENPKLADFFFEAAGSSSAYRRLLALQGADAVCAGIPPLEALRAVVRSVFSVSRAPDANSRARWGFIRCRGVGRNVPTFHQMRRYRVPVYPYLDVGVREAYAALAPSELAGKHAHFALLAKDTRLSRWPVSRSGLSARREWILLHIFRYGWKLRAKWPKLSGPWRKEDRRPDMDAALERTWREIGGASEFWRRWSAPPRPPGYYAMSKNLIDLRRLQKIVEKLVPAGGMVS